MQTAQEHKGYETALTGLTDESCLYLNWSTARSLHLYFLFVQHNIGEWPSCCYPRIPDILADVMLEALLPFLAIGTAYAQSVSRVYTFQGQHSQHAQRNS